MKNIRHHLLAFAFITLTIVVGKSVLHPPIAHAQGNNCCSDGAWIWQHVGGSCEDTEWQRGYDACLQKQCGVCQPAAVRDNGICESGENEGTHPLDCAPGGGNYVAPASSGGGTTAVSTAGKVCFDGAPTASACRGGKKDGEACTGFDGTCIANGTNTSGATLCGCRPKQIVACDNVPNSTNNYNATAVCVGGTSCNAYGRNSSNGGNGCQAGYVCCSKVVSFTPTASSAPVYGSNNQQTLPVTSPTTTNATNLATANQQLINGAPSVRVEITTSTGQTVSVLQVPNRHCQGDTVTDTCSVNQICTLGANGYVCMTPSQAALVTIATNTYVSAVGCGQQGTSTDPATKQFLCGNQCNWVGEIVRTGQTCGGARSSSIVTPVPPTLTACSSPNQCMPTAACSDLGGSTVANRTCSSGNICCSKTAPQVVVTPQPATGRALNQDCTSDSQCTSLYCAPISSTNPDKVCTVRPTPAMSACRAGETVFTPVVSGGAVDPNASRCSSTILVTAYQCNAGFTYTSGACRKVLGQRCTQSVECASNSCEGVCTELVQTVLCTRSMLPGTASPSTAIPQNASVCRTSDNVLHFQCNAGYISNTVGGVSSCVLPTQVGVATVTYPSCLGLRSKLTRSVDISSPVPIGAEICSESSTQLRYQCDSEHTASVTGNECLLIGARVQVSTPIPSPTATPTPVSTPTPGPVCGTFSDTGCNDGKARKGDACVNSSGQKGTCTARLEFAGYLNCECKPLPTTSPSTSTTTTTTTENLMKTSIPIAVATPVPTSKITTNESATQKGLNEPCAVLSAGDLQGNCQSTLRCILDQYGRFCRPIPTPTPTPSPTPKGYGARCTEGERCATNLSCVNSLCRRINGQQCATGGECVSGNCQSGVCQNATPTPTATPRSTVAPCTTPNRCVGSGVCSRSGVQAQSCPTSGGQTQVCCSDKGVVGTSCVSGEQCHSGYCDLSDGPSRGVCTTPITCTRSVGELTTQAGSNRERCTNPNNTSGTWYQCVTGTTGRQVGTTFECTRPQTPTPVPTPTPINLAALPVCVGPTATTPSQTTNRTTQCVNARTAQVYYMCNQGTEYRNDVNNGWGCWSTEIPTSCENSAHGSIVGRQGGLEYYCCSGSVQQGVCEAPIDSVGGDVAVCSECQPFDGYVFGNNMGCGRCPNDQYHQESDGKYYCGPSTRTCRPACTVGSYTCVTTNASAVFQYCSSPYNRTTQDCGNLGCNTQTGQCNRPSRCAEDLGGVCIQNLTIGGASPGCGTNRAQIRSGVCSTGQICCEQPTQTANATESCISRIQTTCNVPTGCSSLLTATEITTYQNMYLENHPGTIPGAVCTQVSLTPAASASPIISCETRGGTCLAPLTLAGQAPSCGNNRAVLATLNSGACSSGQICCGPEETQMSRISECQDELDAGRVPDSECKQILDAEFGAGYTNGVIAQSHIDNAGQELIVNIGAGVVQDYQIRVQAFGAVVNLTNGLSLAERVAAGALVLSPALGNAANDCANDANGGTTNIECVTSYGSAVLELFGYVSGGGIADDVVTGVSSNADNLDDITLNLINSYGDEFAAQYADNLFVAATTAGADDVVIQSERSCLGLPSCIRNLFNRDTPAGIPTQQPVILSQGSEIVELSPTEILSQMKSGDQVLMVNLFDEADPLYDNMTRLSRNVRLSAEGTNTRVIIVDSLEEARGLINAGDASPDVIVMGIHGTKTGGVSPLLDGGNLIPGPQYGNSLVDSFGTGTLSNCTLINITCYGGTGLGDSLQETFTAAGVQNTRILGPSGPLWLDNATGFPTRVVDTNGITTNTWIQRRLQ